MARRIAGPAVLSHDAVRLSAMGLLPSGVRTARFASLAEANLARPACLSKGCFSEFSCVLATLLAQRKFLRYRASTLLTCPPIGTRFGFCIGCDHAAHNRKETLCPATMNPPARSNSSRYRLLSGGMRRRSLFATQSHSRRATKTALENGSLLRASAKVTCCSWRRPQIWPMTKFKTTIVVTSTLPRTSQKLLSGSGQGALIGVLPYLFVTQYDPQGVSAYAEKSAPGTPTSSFLPPRPNLKIPARRVRPCFVRAFCIRIIPPPKCGKTLAMRPGIRFTCRMIRANNAGSKLCADNPRHATGHRLPADAVAQLGKGQGFAPPRCIPSHVPQAAAETLPVSAPSARFAVVAFAAWAVRP